jgi:hypothetical protein
VRFKFFAPLRILLPDPKTATKDRGEKKIVVPLPFFCSLKFHKIQYYFIFEEKNLGQFSKEL